MHKRIRLLITLSILMSLTLLAAKPRIFVSILPQRYFVQQIAPGEFEIDVMVQPGSSPATYEPTPRQMARLSEAELYFSIGVPLEQAWLARMQASNPGVEFVAMQQNVPTQPMPDFEELFAHNHDDHHTHHEHQHDHGAHDPHVWLNTRHVKTMVQTIVSTLSTRNPDAAERYQANARAFAAHLDALHDSIAAQLQPLSKRSFLVFHPSWGYFAQEFDLQQIPIEIEGKEPTVRELGAIIDFARQKQISVVFVQKQFSQAVARSVAESIKGTVVSIDPLAEDYQANLRSIATVIAEELR